MSAAFTLSAPGTVALGSNSGKRVAGTNAFDANSQFATVGSFAGGALAVWSVPQTSAKVIGGLTQVVSPTSPNRFAYDFAIYADSDGTASPYIDGVIVGSFTPVAYVAGSIFSINYDGKDVTFYIDGVLIHTEEAVGAGLVLFFGGCINNTNAILANVEFSIPAPVAFSISGLTPSTTPPVQFFPGDQWYPTTAAMAIQPTALVTAGASIVVFVGTPSAFSSYILTAGAAAEDATHVRPSDYNASTNAKTWVKTTTYP